MRQIERATRLSLVVATGLVLAACGGGGDSGGGGSSEGRMQVISFAYPGGGTLMAGPTTLHATATSALPVVFESGTPQTCTVSGDQLTLVAAGECLVYAHQAGGQGADGVQWAAANTVSQLFNVLKHAQMPVLPIGAVTMGTGETVSLSATTDGGVPATYVSKTASVCTVDGSTLTLNALGVCELDITAPATESFEAMAGKAFISVNNVPPFVIRTGGQVQTVALGAVDAGGQPLTYTTDSPSVCAVAGRELQILAQGACRLVANSGGGSSRTFTIGVDPRSFASGFDSRLKLTSEFGEVNLGAGSALDGWCGGKNPSWCNVTMDVTNTTTNFSAWAIGAYDIKPRVPDNANWGANSSIAWSYYGFQIGAPRTRVLKADGTLDRYNLTPFQVPTESTLFISYGVDPTLYSTGAKVFVRIQTGHAVVKADGNTCYVTVSQLPDMTSAAVAGHMLQLSDFAITDNCGLAGVPKTEGWMFNWGVTAESKAAALAEIKTHGIRLIELGLSSMNTTVSAPRADGTVPAKTDLDYTLTNEIMVVGPITVQ